jgi:hypothetical protein
VVVVVAQDDQQVEKKLLAMPVNDLARVVLKKKFKKSKIKPVLN